MGYIFSQSIKNEEQKEESVGIIKKFETDILDNEVKRKYFKNIIYSSNSRPKHIIVFLESNLL